MGEQATETEPGWELLLPFLEPVATYLRDQWISEIMINPDSTVYIERDGAMALTPVRFPAALLEASIDRIARRLGGDISEREPLFEGRLPDGSRVAIIMPPCSVGGITLTIRKFQHHRFTAAELLRLGSITGRQLDFLAAAVQGRKNVLISGGTGSGKTVLLNVLTEFIPDSERIILLEDVSEIHASNPHQVRLEARHGQDGMPDIPISRLLRATLRHRPDRLIVGEVRGAEAYDLLQALNTGHSGSLSTLQADSAEQATTRLTTCVMQHPSGLTHRYIRRWIADSIQVLVHLERREGKRGVRQILQLDGYDAAEDRYNFTEAGAP